MTQGSGGRATGCRSLDTFLTAAPIWLSSFPADVTIFLLFTLRLPGLPFFLPAEDFAVPFQTFCPACKVSYNFVETVYGQKVPCRNCQKYFYAGQPEKGADNDPPLSAQVVVAQPVSSTPAGKQERPKGEPRPSSPQERTAFESRRTPEPAHRRRQLYDDEDYEAAPPHYRERELDREPASRSGLLLGLILGIGLPALAGLGVLLVILLNKEPAEKNPETVQENPGAQAPLVRQDDREPLPAPPKVANTDFASRYVEAPDNFLLVITNNHTRDFINSSLTLHWFQGRFGTNAQQRLNWLRWNAGQAKVFKLAKSDKPQSVRLEGQVTTPDNVIHQVNCPFPNPVAQLVDDQGGAKEPLTTLPETAFLISYREKPRVFILSVTNNHGVDFRTVSLTFRYIKSNSRKHAQLLRNWSPWKAGRAKLLAFFKSQNPRSLSLTGVVTTEDGKSYRVNCKLPDPVAQPKNDPAGEKELPATLGRAGFLVSYSHTPTHVVLSVTNNHGVDFANSSLTLRWYQAAYRSRASQVLNWGAWNAGQTQQFQLAKRENPRLLRLVGSITTKDGKNHRVNFALPQPR
jgi:hypothetical protein